VPSILLFVVADFIVKLFQVVLEGGYFILGGTNCILKAHDVFIALLNDFFLMSDPILSRLNLSHQALLRVLRCLIRVILGLGPLSQLLDLLTLTQVDSLGISEVLLDHVDLALFAGVTRLGGLELVGHPLQLLLFVIVICAS